MHTYVFFFIVEVVSSFGILSWTQLFPANISLTVRELIMHMQYFHYKGTVAIRDVPTVVGSGRDQLPLG